MPFLLWLLVFRAQQFQEAIQDRLQLCNSHLLIPGMWPTVSPSALEFIHYSLYIYSGLRALCANQ